LGRKNLRQPNSKSKKKMWGRGGEGSSRTQNTGPGELAVRPRGPPDWNGQQKGTGPSKGNEGGGIPKGKGFAGRITDNLRATRDQRKKKLERRHLGKTKPTTKRGGQRKKKGSTAGLPARPKVERC